MHHTAHIVPRWAGRFHSDWYESFTLDVEAALPATALKCLAMPRWDNPDTGEILRFLDAEIPVIDESTILIGHSVGCLAVLRFLEERARLDPELRAGGMLLVAAWFAIDNPWPTLLPWMQNDGLDYAAARRACPRVRVLISDNDPHTSDQAANRRLWEERLGAEVSVHPGCAHFNGPHYPEIAEAFKQIVG